MNVFYTMTALAMIVLLASATALVFAGRKKAGDWWLAGFLLSLVLNAIWSLVGPFLGGMEETLFVYHIGNVVFRVVSLIGYVALLAYVIKRISNAVNN
jgi:hypothetical protein